MHDGSADDIASRHDRFRAAFAVLLERAGAVRRGVRIAGLIAVADGAFPYLERVGDSRGARKGLLTSCFARSRREPTGAPQITSYRHRYCQTARARGGR